MPFVNGEYYHLFNRGSDKRPLFLQPRDYKRLQQTFYYYQFIGPKPRFSIFTKSQLSSFKPSADKKLVDIICFCLMPNHFHFLVKQLKTNGISIFMSQISNSYTKYFNTKYKRIGPLLQGSYKGVWIENDEQFIHVSRYIHLNPVVGGIAKKLDDYLWSSYHEYVNNDAHACTINDILGFFPSPKAYKKFLEDQIDYGRCLEVIKNHLTDED